MRLTEAEFIEIEERAARKFRVWERNYAPQDIRLEHHLSWWIAQEVAEHLSHKDEIHAPSVERDEDRDLRAATAALIALSKHNIPTDVQELLVRGDPMRGIPPGALSASWAAALRELMKEVG